MTINQTIFRDGRALLDSFINDLDNLKHYIEVLELQKELISNLAEDDLRSELLRIWISEYKSKFDIMRRFNYNSIIISLYGFVEQYIESLIKDYLTFLNETVPYYENLPDSILKNHLPYSIHLINLAEKSNNRNYDSIDIISNLNSCICGGEDYKINVDAFSYHTANFRSELITRQFKDFGVENISERIKKRPQFIEYFKENHPDQAPSLFYLDDLVERRNEVAHGVLPDEILSNDLILEYVQFIDVYGRVLYEIILSEALCFLAIHRGISLGSPINIFDHKIVCISINNTPVEVGDWLIAKTHNSDIPYLASPIEKIEIDGKDHNSVPSCPSIEIGMQISFKAKRNHEFYLMHKN